MLKYSQPRAWEGHTICEGLMHLRRTPFAANAVLLVLLGAIAPAVADGQRCLNDLERKVAQDYADVRALTAEQFEARLAENGDVIVFDVRDKAEFEVSRLPGAIRVEPSISATEFMRRHGATVSGKTVLLYCSVGVRSSRLARRIDKAVRSAGAEGAFNLRGGVFSWHNTGRKLVAGDGATEIVHGYSRDWSRYIDFDNLIRYDRSPPP
jgi:rhodanese-related sulfurtransferase